MRSRVRAIIILNSAVSFLVLVALGRGAATISLSNDVVLLYSVYSGRRAQVDRQALRN
jgi:hypothetical protein